MYLSDCQLSLHARIIGELKKKPSGLPPSPVRPKATRWPQPGCGGCGLGVGGVCDGPERGEKGISADLETAWSGSWSLSSVSTLAKECGAVGRLVIHRRWMKWAKIVRLVKARFLTMGGGSYNGEEKKNPLYGGRLELDVSVWEKNINIYKNLDRRFPGGSDDQVSACNAGDLGLIPGLGKSPGEGNGNPLQYSCLENSMDGRAW